MALRLPWLLVCIGLCSGCTGKAEAVRAARPHVDTFRDLRGRALDLLELRASVERKKLLLAASQGDEDQLPENLRPVLDQMRAQGVELTQAQLDQGEAIFWRMLDRAFSESPDVLQAEIVLLEKGGAVSAFRYPREREVPAGLRWYGMREQRTFAAVGRCLTEDGSEPCVLLQRRPRDYAGSAGLTVAFRQAP